VPPTHIAAIPDVRSSAPLGPRTVVRRGSETHGPSESRRSRSHERARPGRRRSGTVLRIRHTTGGATYGPRQFRRTDRRLPGWCGYRGLPRTNHTRREEASGDAIVGMSGNRRVAYRPICAAVSMSPCARDRRRSNVYRRSCGLSAWYSRGFGSYRSTQTLGSPEVRDLRTGVTASDLIIPGSRVRVPPAPHGPCVASADWFHRAFG
jgi:hypothetical protein